MKSTPKKKRNGHGQRKNVALGTQHNLYSTDYWVMQILGLVLGFSIFRYQHVGIPKAKLWHWGSKPTPGRNANSFASLWNIGLKVPNRIFRLKHI